MIAMPGIKEALQRVPSLPIVKNEPHVLIGWPTAKVNDVLVFFWFDRAVRADTLQMVNNDYIVGIRVCVPWQDNSRAEEQIAPFVNTIPAVFDRNLQDSDGHSYATLGGRVRWARITDVRSGDTDGFVNIGGTDTRSILFELTVTEDAPLGAGL
jgi:hypothetical protein